MNIDLMRIIYLNILIFLMSTVYSACQATSDTILFWQESNSLTWDNYRGTSPDSSLGSEIVYSPFFDGKHEKIAATKSTFLNTLKPHVHVDLNPNRTSTWRGVYIGHSRKKNEYRTQSTAYE